MREPLGRAVGIVREPLGSAVGIVRDPLGSAVGIMSRLRAGIAVRLPAEADSFSRHRKV